eukprot:2714905-Rhodomonas_salina.2
MGELHIASEQVDGGADLATVRTSSSRSSLSEDTSNLSSRVCKTCVMHEDGSLRCSYLAADHLVLVLQKALQDALEEQEERIRIHPAHSTLFRSLVAGHTLSREQDTRPMSAQRRVAGVQACRQAGRQTVCEGGTAGPSERMCRCPALRLPRKASVHVTQRHHIRSTRLAHRTDKTRVIIKPPCGHRIQLAQADWEAHRDVTPDQLLTPLMCWQDNVVMLQERHRFLFNLSKVVSESQRMRCRVKCAARRSEQKLHFQTSSLKLTFSPPPSSRERRCLGPRRQEQGQVELFSSFHEPPPPPGPRE